MNLDVDRDLKSSSCVDCHVTCWEEDLPAFIQQGCAALEAVTSAAVLFVCSSLSFPFLCLIRHVRCFHHSSSCPAVGAVVYLQMLLPLVGVTKRGEYDEAGASNKQFHSNFCHERGFCVVSDGSSQGFGSSPASLDSLVNRIWLNFD